MLKALGTTETKNQFTTRVISEANVKPAIENWGKFLPYYEGDTQHIKDVAKAHGQLVQRIHLQKQEILCIQPHGNDTAS